MMRLLTILSLVLLLASSARAQSQESIDPKILKEVEELYERKDEVKSFVFLLIERRLARDMALSLEGKDFSEDEITEVLESEEFRSYTEKVLAHPDMQEHVERFVENTLHPDRLRRVFLRRKAELRAMQTTQMILMLRRLVMDRELRLDPPPEEGPSFLERVLASIQGYFQEKVN